VDPVRHKGEVTMSYAIENPLAPAPEAASRLAPEVMALSELGLLRLALNQMDYGLVVVEADSAKLQFANALGHDALREIPDSAHGRRCRTGLLLSNGRVTAHRAADCEQLRRTLERTRSGLRGFLNLGEGGQTSAVAVLPLAGQPVSPPIWPRYGPGASTASYALLVFSKLQLCDDSTMALFARERGLTSAEGQVLAQVCNGLRPSQIANNHGVQISTVRTQLRSIRMKTCSETIRDLVQKVSVLPPMARHMPGQVGA